MTTREQLEEMQRSETISMMMEAIRGLLPEIKAELMQLLQPKENMEYYTRKQVCEIFHVELNTLHTWMREGRIKFKKVGRRTLFEKHYIDSAELGRYCRKRK